MVFFFSIRSVVLVILCIPLVDVTAFSSAGRIPYHPVATLDSKRTSRGVPLQRRAPTLSALPPAMSTCTDWINDWYLTYPYLSALMTCSCKAGVADYIVQSTATEAPKRRTVQPSKEVNTSINVGRNFGFILYGGLYQGVFQQYMYGSVFPTYFDESIPMAWSTLIQLVLDMAFLGPCLCLPVAYFVQSMCTTSLWQSQASPTSAPRHQHRFDWYPGGLTTSAVVATDPSALDRVGTVAVAVFHHGWEQYLHDVKHEQILIKYWSLWIPVKLLTFTLIPCHLRIVFIATISFFWMMVLSNASTASQQSESS